jgi:hypothetical protein
MSEQSAVVEATATPIDISRGPLVDLTPEQRKDYKATGNLPTPKTEEAATSSVAGESETPKKQVVPKKSKSPLTAEERIAQLESTIETIRKGAGLETKPKAESTPAKSEPVKALTNRPKPEDFETHDAYEEAVVEWKIDQREAEKAAKAAQAAEEAALNGKIEKARTRYDNLDEVVNPAIETIVSDKGISPVIKQMLYDSEITPDLVFTIASNKEEFQDFLKMAKENPGKAIRYVALTESLIAQELEGKSTPVVEEIPAKPTTKAPKPPAEAGGRAATPPDSLQAAVEASRGSLSRDLKAEFLRRDLAKLKG